MVFSVEPSILHFPFNEINPEEDYTRITYTKTLKLRNSSGEKCRFSVHILQEQKDFKIVQIKTGAVFPGKYEKVIVQFSPKLWKVSQAVFYVKASKSADMVPVTLTGFPSLTKLSIPKGIDFGNAVLYEPKEKIITIENDIPVDFQYDITLSRELPPNYFFVSPMRGTIRGLEKLEISISFIPLTLCQAQMELIFRTSEYNFNPMKCLVFGSGILEIPTELPVKQILNPIASKATGDKVMASPFFKKEDSIQVDEVTTSVKEPVRKKKSTVDVFTAELEANLSFIRSSELRRFVSIGKDTSKEEFDKDINMINRPISGLQLSATADISKFRIEAPSIIQNANLSQSLYDRNGNRLLQLFLKAIYKVIFRIRADKRIRQLKDYIAGVSQAKVAPAAEKKFEHNYQPRPKKVHRKSVIPIVKKVIYPVTVPQLPELIKPRPIALLEPSYAEKKGFVKLVIPVEDNIFNIQVPKLQFDSKTEAETFTAYEGLYQPAIPEIEIEGYENNPLPGVANMYIPHITSKDESSLSHIFRTSASVDISSYPALSDLEVNLKRSTRYGTRLRPLTFSKPKPLVEFANRPMIIHQIEALAKVGVKEIVLAVNYQPEVMVQAMQQVEEEFKIKITFSIEDEPLGTAGPLSLARGVLGMDESPFFVLNSDVICEFPFKSLLDFHKAHGAEGTLMTTPVEDPSKYGVICLKEGTTKIERFVEKPTNWVGDQINAGIYIFNPPILKRIDHLKGPMSIEKEVFPKMAKDGQLHATPLAGFWADVGQPKDFLTGTALYLNSLFQRKSSDLNTGDHVVGNVIIHPSVKIGAGCKIGPNVVIGPNVTIGAGVRLSNSVLMAGVTIKDFCWIKDSIIGWHSSVGRWARLDATTVLGEDVHVKDEIFTNGATVLPHKSVGANIMSPQIVM